MPDSLTIEHRYMVQFDFPPSVTERVEAVCMKVGGGLSFGEKEGVWKDGNGNRVKDDMRLGIVTLKNEIAIDYLRQRIGWILAEYGEDCMWFVHHEIKGGIFDLQDERAGFPVPSDLPEMKRPISIQRKTGTPLVVHRLRRT